MQEKSYLFISIYYLPNLNLKSFPSHKGPLGGVSIALSQPKLQVHGHGASVSPV